VWNRKEAVTLTVTVTPACRLLHVNRGKLNEERLSERSRRSVHPLFLPVVSTHSSWDRKDNTGNLGLFDYIIYKLVFYMITYTEEI